MPDLDPEVQDGMLTVKNSRRGVRAEILRFLAESPYASPTEMLERVEDTTDVSRASFYDNLEVLREEELVTRIGGSGQGTMYELSALGEDVMEHLGLDEQKEVDTSDSPKTVEEEIDRLLTTYDVTPSELINRLEKRNEIRQR